MKQIELEALAYVIRRLLTAGAVVLALVVVYNLIGLAAMGIAASTVMLIYSLYMIWTIKVAELSRRRDSDTGAD